MLGNVQYVVRNRSQAISSVLKKTKTSKLRKNEVCDKPLKNAYQLGSSNNNLKYFEHDKYFLKHWKRLICGLLAYLKQLFSKMNWNSETTLNILNKS